MNVWEIAILKSIKSLDGEAGLQRIYERISDFRPLAEEHLRETEWGGRPAHQHQVRSHITNSCQAGELTRTSRGRYSVTDKGTQRIAIDNKNHSNRRFG